MAVTDTTPATANDRAAPQTDELLAHCPGARKHRRHDYRVRPDKRAHQPPRQHLQAMLRTVIVREARRLVVLLPSCRLEFLRAKPLHGQPCAHRVWDEVLGPNGNNDEFGMPMAGVTQIRQASVNTSRRKH